MYRSPGTSTWWSLSEVEALSDHEVEALHLICTSEQQQKKLVFAQKMYLALEKEIFCLKNVRMKKIRAAIVGYGNIGKYVLDALQSSPDFEVAGIVRRNPNNNPAELSGYQVVAAVKDLADLDVAILCTPTRSVESYAKECLALGVNTVDSYDIHGGIVALR